MKMDREILRRLELLNQLRLTEEEKEMLFRLLQKLRLNLESDNK